MTDPKLPPELIAMNAAMDMIFNAVGKAPLDPYRKVEDEIMALKGFDYGYASDLFAAFHAKLERTYEDRLDSDVEHAMNRFAKALDKAYGQL